MLCYTSYLDIKKREVEDKVWIVFGIAAAVLQAYEIAVGISSDIEIVVGLALAALVGMGLFYFGFYGGADGKALIVLAIFVPFFVPQVGLYPIAPLIVLTNGVLLSILLPIAMLVLNLSRLIRGQRIFEGFSETVPRKILACLLGYKQTGKPRSFQFSMEREEKLAEHSVSTHQRKFDFALMKDDFTSESGTWVTPGIPLLVFFTAGFFALLIYGDLVIGLIMMAFKAFGS